MTERAVKKNANVLDMTKKDMKFFNRVDMPEDIKNTSKK
jgi:hypothetical protein